MKGLANFDRFQIFGSDTYIFEIPFVTVQFEFPMILYL